MVQRHFAATMFTVATTVLSTPCGSHIGDNFCAPSLMLCGPITMLLAQLPQGVLVSKDVVMQHNFIPITRGFSLRSVSVPPCLCCQWQSFNRTSDGAFHKPTKSLLRNALLPRLLSRGLAVHGEPIGIAATNCRICKFAPSIAAGWSIPMSHTIAHDSKNYFPHHSLCS